MVALGLVVGLLAWVVLWLNTDPRAGWDSLVYHKFAFEYAGLSTDEQDARSWELYERYAADDEVAYVVAALGTQPWSFDVPPTPARWAAQYRMRPLYPVLVAAAYPLAGMRAPLMISAAATVITLGCLSVGLAALAGPRVALGATAVTLLNGLFTRWMVTLTPDGLAIALWALSVTAGAIWVVRGQSRWLLLLVVAGLALALARPLGMLLPLVFVLGVPIAWLRKDRIWRRFAIAGLSSGLAAGVVLAVFTAAGFPSFTQLLQDLPTVHFSRPDVADPFGWMISMNEYRLRASLIPGLAQHPLVAVSIVAGVAGLFVARRWWAVPYLCALLVIPVSWVIHPEITQLDRTLAPAWLSIHAGFGVLISWIAIRWRETVIRAADWFTRKESVPSEG
jgi:hypothetical protein